MSPLEDIINSLQKELKRLEKLEVAGASYKIEKRLIQNTINKLTGRGQVKLSKYANQRNKTRY